MRRMDAKKLESALAQFCGTENYYKYNIFGANLVLTDGVKFLCDEAKCIEIAQHSFIVNMLNREG